MSVKVLAIVVSLVKPVIRVDLPSRHVVSDYQVLFVAGGVTDGYRPAGTEAIDLSGSLGQCRPLPNTPTEMRTPAYGLFQEKPTLCGGYSDLDGYISTCVQFQSDTDEWELVANMALARDSPAGAVVPGVGFWITGGVNDGLIFNSTEILNGDLVIEPGPFLPIPLWGHCIVQVDDTHTMVAGGFNLNGPNPRSFMFNWDSGTWSSLTNMSYARYFHGCGKMITSGNSDVVVLAFSGDHAYTTELYSVADDRWVLRDPLQRPLFATGAEYQNTVLSVGGFTYEEGAEDDIYQHTLDGGWQELPIKLSQSHFWHAAFVVSNDHC